MKSAPLRTFESMRTSMPDAYAKCRLDLYITGYGTRAYEQKVLDRGLEQKIRFHDPVAPRQIFQELAASDLVLAFIPSMNKDILGTKFNEIFQLRRPLLHIGLPGLVSRTILGRKLGGSLRVEEIEDELPRLISGEHRIELDLDADLSDGLLGPITDRLLREVLA